MICGRDRVDAVVVAGAEQGQRAAVGAARDADPRVAVVVLQDLVALGQQVEQGGEVGDLVAGVVQPDLPGAAAEAAGGVGEDDVAAPGEVLRVGVHATACCRRTRGRGRPPVRATRRPTPGGRAWCRARRPPLRSRRGRAPPRSRRPRRRRRAGRPRADQRTGAGEAGRRASRGRRSAGGNARARERGARSGQRTAGGTCSARRPEPDGSAGQGCQSPAATTTRPGAVASAGSSKKRGVGPWSCGNCSISWRAACRWFSSPSVKKTVEAATSPPS